MASTNQFLITLAVVAVLLPTVAFATDYIVGGNSNWTVGIDYVAWARDKDFFIGDKLIFRYPVGMHNVFKVNGTIFNNCTIPPVSEALATGNDVITIDSPGEKWYFCGVADHCKRGQKLTIIVWPEPEAPAPAPNAAIATSITCNSFFCFGDPGLN